LNGGILSVAKRAPGLNEAAAVEAAPKAANVRPMRVHEGFNKD
jgi:hypothetical protein